MCCWPSWDGDSQLPGKVDAKPSLHLTGAGRGSQRTSWDCQPQPGLRDAPSAQASPRSEEGQLAVFVPEGRKETDAYICGSGWTEKT